MTSGRGARKAPLAEPLLGTSGQVPGVGALCSALNRFVRSDFAVEGGSPFASAGASVHHPSVLPSRSRTATRPCIGSFSV